VAAVVDNPLMGSAGYRQTEVFYERCAELRALLAAEGALHPDAAAAAAAGGAA
jgi:hypothetical protein